MAFPSIPPIPSIPSIPKSISKPIKYFIFGIFILNIKSLPLVYNLRYLPMISKLQIKKYTNYKKKNKDLFKAFERSHFVFVDDLDTNFHLNNGSYNKHMDWARAEFVMLQFPEASVKPNFSLAISGVSMYFKKEIPRFSTFKIQTKILTWNGKWIFLIHRFITESKNNSDNTNDNKNINVHAVGITKLVFKEKNGKTVIPEQFFDENGFKCETEESKIKREEIRKKGWKFIEGLLEFEKLIDYCEDKDRDEDDYLENEKVISKL
ncbi:hypothetical protein Glove_21g249 [Diversispora epigaea]|uniref:Thioesterase domain-containing protein n=1 Tax=Diversispora epigaea TaxID=1348612 RepID=A0A397JJV0_9GLOM|nr:hypothetical protein Glove_21g249 [Diversispora epigaea]